MTRMTSPEVLTPARVARQASRFEFADAVLRTRVALRRARLAAQMYDLVTRTPTLERSADIGLGIVGDELCRPKTMHTRPEARSGQATARPTCPWGLNTAPHEFAHGSG